MKKYFTMLALTMMMTLGIGITAAAEIPADAVAFNGHWYKFYNVGCKWTEANAACTSLGGHLVTITSQAEQDFCRSLMGSTCPKYCWIGAAHSSSGWRWITGEKWDYTNWSYDQPNRSGGGDYALIQFFPGQSGTEKYTWDDQNDTGVSPSSKWTGDPYFQFTATYSYICEWDFSYTGEGLIPYTVPEEEMNNTIRTTTKEEIPGASYPLLQARAINVKSNSFTLKWNKLTGATKYLIYGNKCNSNGKRYRYQYITQTTKTSYKPKGLKKNTFYKYVVVAVANDRVIAVSKTVHAGLKTQPNPTKVTVNKKKITISTSAVKKFQLKCSIKGTKLKQHRKVAYETDNVNVARVNKKGLITAVGPGRCNVYAYAQNGVCAKITVTVLK